MKKQKVYINKQPSVQDRLKLAFAFIGENKELFIQWLKEKGLSVQEEDITID